METLTSLDLSDALPDDGCAGTLVGRAWVPGRISGPSVVAIRDDGVYDLSELACTISGLLELDALAERVRRTPGRRLGSLAEILRNTGRPARDASQPHLLAPCDLQVIKAAGVTFAASMLERVIEEQAGGDASRADAVRQEVKALIGDNLAAVRPGSAQADALKQLLIKQGLWSQYLEVGIGPYAEIFTKAPVLAAVGTGADIGIHPESTWNNPEPEVVLAVNSAGTVLGAALGNDVNLRDFEGRSALLLSKAKDNNASCAIGPFLRLFDATFSMDDVRAEEIQLRVEGGDGFVLRGANSMSKISRDPLDLVAQAASRCHQYPDGFMLYLGTLFAPTEDRDAPGCGFTHKLGDVVTIRSHRLGTLRNRVNLADQAEPWTFGIRALVNNLAARGLLSNPL
ncbi:fumarylacetoacetate hydrolase [Burkholderiaceae bacterium 16]|nr:fumarylacetoacetate hydrolase [Burkholderiaceae bacterium 16]